MQSVLSRTAPAKGINGYADLRLAMRDGRTRIVQLATRAPLAVQRALYVDEALPDLAVVFLGNTGPGILEGDLLRVAVRVDEGARALVTTQSATKIHTMPQGEARQHTELVIMPGGCFEYLPDPLIPFRGARFTQTTEITVHRGAVLVFWDILTPGRVAHGEALAYEAYRQQLTVRDETGRPLYHEAFELRPDGHDLSEVGILGLRNASLGTLIAVAPGAGDQLAAALRERTQTSCMLASSSLPVGEGVVMKAVSDSLSSLRNALHDAWAIVRSVTYGANVTALRKY